MDAVIEEFQVAFQKMKVGMDVFEVDLRKLRKRTFTDQGAPSLATARAFLYSTERSPTATQCDFETEEPSSKLLVVAPDDRSGGYI